MLTPEERAEIIEALEISFSDLNQAIQGGQETADRYLGNVLRSAANDPRKLKAWDVLFAEMNRIDPVFCKQLITALKVKSTTLEMMGYEKWLRTLGPHTFTGSFADSHHELWGWYWEIIRKLRRNIPLDLEDLVFIAAWPRDYGKCLAKGTEVLREDGTRIPIEQVVKGDWLLSIDVATGRSVVDRVKDVWFTGTRRCVKLKTRTGKILELTLEHRLWAFDGWKTAEQLQVGDRIALPRRTRPRCSETRTDGEVRLVAYMIAEGSTTFVKRPYPNRSCHAGFTNADKTIVDDFKKCAERMGFTVKYRCRYMYFLGGAQDWLRDVGLSGKGAHEKRVPEWVFRLPEDQRWQFLAAMIDTDGWTTKSEGLAICLTSGGLIDDLCYLFLSVGVVTTKRPKTNHSPARHRQAWTLSVDKEYLSRCATYMPLRLKGEKLLQAVSYSRHSLLDTYPRSAGRNLPAGANRKIRNLGGPALSASNFSVLTRPKVRAAMALCALPQLAWLEQAEVFWDEIVSIEPCGVRDVYDLDMASTSHNFIANGIVSHNSSHAEWIAIAEGAMVGTGYVLYVCRTQAQSEEHVLSIRNRIEAEKVAQTYPRLGKPKMGTHGNRYGWGREFVMTGGGFAFRPMGLDVAGRGGKVLDVRPSLIILGDIDKINDSLAVVESNSQTIQREILPMGTPQTRILVEQNPIHSASWLSNILNRISDALAVRRVSGPIPAFKDIKIEFRQTEHGPRNIITGGTPTWKDMSLEKCQAFLDRSGLNAFRAEYLHDFSAEQDERVLPEYDDRILRLHVITWSQFIGMYFEDAENPPRRIPNYWPCSLGGDIGYTAGHLSAFSWLTRVPANAPLTGTVFRYRGLTLTGAAPDEIGARVRNAMWPARGEYKGEMAQIIQQVLSHEALGERLLLNQNFGFSFMPCDKGKESGLVQWRHHLRPDRSQKHPFHRDELLLDGTWKLGRPSWFDIVADDQFVGPHDDAGMKTHRNTAYTWRRKKVKLTESGLTKDQPMKIDDDPNDSTRSQLATGMMGPPIIPLTEQEKLLKAIPKGYDWSSLQKKVEAKIILPEQAQMTAEYAYRRAQRFMAQKRAPLTDEFGNDLAAD